MCIAGTLLLEVCDTRKVMCDARGRPCRCPCWCDARGRPCRCPCWCDARGRPCRCPCWCDARGRPCRCPCYDWGPREGRARRGHEEGWRCKSRWRRCESAEETAKRRHARVVRAHGGSNARTGARAEPRSTRSPGPSRGPSGA
eukprot:SAG11_NODE_10212_length_846_cov_5.165997_1_plen_143_part_00